MRQNYENSAILEKPLPFFKKRLKSMYSQSFQTHCVTLRIEKKNFAHYLLNYFSYFLNLSRDHQTPAKLYRALIDVKEEG